MTVPLLRRRGLSMTQATAMANPLSLPVALVGTAVYMLAGDSGVTGLGLATLAMSISSRLPC